MSARVIPAAEPPSGLPVGHWPLRPEAASARLARNLVTQAMLGAQDHALRRAALVTSELVTNSVRYGHGGLGLGLQRLRDGWVVSVMDGSSAPPHRRDNHLYAETGRGMLIVERVSQSIGWALTPTGKVVWAFFADSGDPSAAT
jgi:hypothetical protein